MSEFQYFEWHTLDRPLTLNERDAVNKLSSHIRVSSTRAQVDYAYGNFKHNPIQVLARYFDAFLYDSNWGTRRLAFRFAADLLPEAALQPYLVDEVVELTRINDVLVLEVRLDDDEGGDWVEEPDLATLAQLRRDLLAGDYRMLYLAWLLANDQGDDNEALEPPLPPGLAELSAPLQAFVEFFAIDPMLVQAAAQASAPPQADAPVLDALIERLPRAECNDYLLRLAKGEANLALKLNRRLQGLRGQPAASAASAPSRTVGDLLEVANMLHITENERQREAAAAQHVKDLEAFAPKAEQAWDEIETLMARKTAGAYAEAVSLLIKLRELAVQQNDLFAFTAHFSDIRVRYSGRSAFQERLRAAGLLEPLL